MNTFRGNPMLKFLMVLTISSMVGLQGWRTLFNNFAVEVAHLEGYHVGVIQSVREVPGFLALLAVYVMLVIREHRLSALSIIVLGAGAALTGLVPSYLGLVTTTLILSFGFHYYETINQSLTLQYFDRQTAPLVFGKLRSLSAASNVGVGIGILVLASVLSYRQMYLIIGGVVVAAGVWGLRQDPTDQTVIPQRKRMILRKKYTLFYLLTFLAGARRQIFVAFAVFLLVKIFGFSVQEITTLFLINNIINYFVSPLIGRAIVRFGERPVLSLEYASLIFIFLAYAFTGSKIVVALMYVLDHIFFNFSIAVRTYFQKIGDPQDIAPSMAMGFTINHLAAVVVPVVGGALWMVDYKIPFVAGAAMSCVSLIAVQFVPRERSGAKGEA